MKLKLILSTLTALIISVQFTLAQSSRELKPFSVIGISGAIDVVLVAGNKDQADITVYKNTKLEHVITEVSGDRLSIRPKKGVRNVNAKVTLTYSSKITKISFSGSSDIEAQNTIKTSNLSLSGSGSGSFKGDVQCSALTSSLSGSGELDLTGKVDEFSISVSGSADIDAKELEAKIVTISVSGSGDVDCFATEEINARVSGSGDIRYKGDPEKTKIKVSGSGDIEKIN
ncbi:MULTISPECIES: head GIN domain-containing protein [Flammeovirga]|uniref:DUF2807 domain-containing protein n=1 Tax=Flammeovirga agarivorans TaxID=2726742 RepID=A0A7X8XU66_9BACT|nr:MULTISPECIES: head GIN domain-containing protein [Flammeovirga]NLR90092.1 DUF2807 domain-containing protein [Flammeovirga agarivorans]